MLLLLSIESEIIILFVANLIILFSNEINIKSESKIFLFILITHDMNQCVSDNGL